MNLLRFLAVAALCAFAVCEPQASYAQSSTPVVLPGGCGTGSFGNSGGYLTMDSTGKLCTSASGGGGGGAVTLASGAVASGAYSAGSYAAGALAAGSFATGAGVDGWDLTQGARADAAWTTGSGSVISLLKAIAGANIVTNRAVNLAQVAGSTVSTGHGVASGAIRVELPTDGTGAVGVNAGTNDIGGIYTTTFSASVTLTITASSNYSAGNLVGGLMTFANVARTPKFSGKIDSVTITSKSIQTGEFDLYLCDANPSASTWTDKAAPAINAADVSKCKWMIPMTANSSGLGTHTTYTATGLGISFVLPASGTSLYGVLVTPSQPSAQFGSTSDLVVTVAGPED